MTNRTSDTQSLRVGAHNSASPDLSSPPSADDQGKPVLPPDLGWKIFGKMPRGWVILILAVLAWIVLALIALAIWGFFGRG
jgi:hypothetical protein